MKGANTVSKDISLIGENSFYIYVKETIAYFNELDINIERIIERVAKELNIN